MSMTLNDPRQPKTWEDADTLLGDRDSMKIGNNTWLHRSYVGDSEDILVRLHSTYIIRYWGPNSSNPKHVTLHSGGYRTVTTKQRMNLLTNVRVTQENYEWFVTEPRKRTADDYLGTLRNHHPYIWFPSDDTMEFGDGDTYLNEL